MRRTGTPGQRFPNPGVPLHRVPTPDFNNPGSGVKTPQQGIQGHGRLPGPAPGGYKGKVPSGTIGAGFRETQARTPANAGRPVSGVGRRVDVKPTVNRQTGGVAFNPGAQAQAASSHALTRTQRGNRRKA